MLKNKILDAIAEAKRRSNDPHPNPLSPGIVGCLEAMLKGPSKDEQANDKLAGALGRLVMEDISIAESQFGLELLSLANEYASEQHPC